MAVHQLFRAQAVPIMIAEKPHSGEPASALQTIKVVELPERTRTEILTDLEVFCDPVDPRLQVAVEPALATVMDLPSLHEFLAFVPAQSGDH